MLMFNDLKMIISRCCFGDKNAKDFPSKFTFTVDCEKLERELQKKNSHLHVMSFNDKVKSERILCTDYQSISEYVHYEKDLNNILDSEYAQIARFILYYDDENNFVDQDGNDISWEEIFNILNDEDRPDGNDLAKNIVRNSPTYSVLMTKIFNNGKEKFEYKIYFRSNKLMMNYINSIKTQEKESFEATTEQPTEE